MNLSNIAFRAVSDIVELNEDIENAFGILPICYGVISGETGFFLSLCEEIQLFLVVRQEKEQKFWCALIHRNHICVAVVGSVPVGDCEWANILKEAVDEWERLEDK